MTVVILGCGYTGRHVARRLATRGIDVIATSRDPETLSDLAVHVERFDTTSPTDLSFVPREAAILYSIPTTVPDRTQAIVDALGDRPSRVVYLSTTGVYGSAPEVDETTPVDPQDSAGLMRVEAERTIAGGPWTTLILRPAAIYGPGRGVHVRMQRGDYSLVGDGSNFVSRIHVEDLAAHADKALSSALTGAYPVADERPCAAREITQFCVDLLGVPMPPSVSASSVHTTRRANRRVDGSAIRRMLDIELRYPSYREGIVASLPHQHIR
jgi:nucleoside-diphosphate-sugar epimerase